MQVRQHLHVIFPVPVVRIQQRDQVETAHGRVGRPHEDGRRADIGVVARQHDVIGVPVLDFRLGDTVGHQHMAARVGLGQHAFMRLPQHLDRLAEIGGDDGDSQGRQGVAPLRQGPL